MIDILYMMVDNPKSEERSEEKTLKRGLRDYNYEQLGERGAHFSIIAKNNELVIGGLIIEKCSDAFYIKTLWVHDSFKKQGIGSKLLTMLDGEAENQNIPKIFTDTYTFQARGFYEKHGFKVIGIIREYILGYDKIYLKKEF